MPLVTPLSTEENEEVTELARFFNETLGFCPNSVLTMQRRPWRRGWGRSRSEPGQKWDCGWAIEWKGFWALGKPIRLRFFCRCPRPNRCSSSIQILRPVTADQRCLPRIQNVIYAVQESCDPHLHGINDIRTLDSKRDPSGARVLRPSPPRNTRYP